MRTAIIRSWIVLLAILSTLSHAQSQGVAVTGKIVGERPKASKTSSQNEVSNVVLWLVPRDDTAKRNTPTPQPQTAKLVQKDKAFHPQLLVLPAGSSVEFPNQDPFFHNVFSLFNGKRFDLGLYEAGESRTTKFERVGTSYIFCNIHPEMSAIIVTMATPYYATSNKSGAFSIGNVLPGVYELHVFADGLSSEAEKKLTREVRVASEQVSLGDIRIPERMSTSQHTNKYGRDYEKPATSPYEH
jgi:plastocyanin